MDINKEYTGLLEAFNSVYENQEQLDEAMSSYDRNRKRAAQRAAERNAARDRGQTGNVPGVGYVSPRREKETYTDESGQERHKSGARMPKNEEVEIDLFDYLLEYLVAEGRAETNKEALAIMANMSAEDIQGIVEATYGGEKPTDIPADKRMVVTNADKAGNTKAYQELMKKNPNYVAAPHLKGV